MLEAFIVPSMLLKPYQANNLVGDEWTLCQYGVSYSDQSLNFDAWISNINDRTA